MKNGPFALIFHGLFVAFLASPLVMVVLVSLTANNYLSLPTNGMSLRWYEAMLQNKQFIAAFKNSLWLGVASASFAVLLSIPAALAIARMHFPGRDTIATVLMSPLLVPHLVLGIAFLQFFALTSMRGSFVGLALAHTVVVMPYALRLLMSAYTGMDGSIEQAARSLGASAFTAFRRVTLPLALPGVVSGWLMAFIHSFDETTMTVFLASPSMTTLPVRIYLHIEETVDPMVAAVSSTLIFLALALMVVLDRGFGLDRLLSGEGAKGDTR
jgi:putative spermidine/putrescine transport system permease protein